MARAGGAVTLKDRQVTIDALSLVTWDDTDPERPIAIVDVVCSAGTYVRALARDLGERVGNAAYLGALRRTAAGPFARDDAVSLDARPRRGGRWSGGAGRRCCVRSMTGLDRFPIVELTPAEVDAVAHGQYVRPGCGDPGASGPLPTACARRDAGGDRRSGRRRTAGTRQGARAGGPRACRSPRLMDVRRRRQGLRPEHGPIFAVIGVFDGLHRGHAYLLEHLVRRGARPRCPSVRDHVRPSSRRGAHRVGAATAARPRRAARAVGRRRRRGDRRPARSTSRAPDDPTTTSSTRSGGDTELAGC